MYKIIYILYSYEIVWIIYVLYKDSMKTIDIIGKGYMSRFTVI